MTIPFILKMKLGSLRAREESELDKKEGEGAACVGGR